MDTQPPALRTDGVFAAVWTPTDTHGHLLEGDLVANVQWLVDKGIHGLLPLGSTGEFLQLEVAQRKRVLELTLEQARGLPVIAHVGDVRPRVVAELGRFARRAGACAIAALPPYFYPVADADLTEYFVRAAEAAQLPLVLYNFPERTGNRVSLRVVAAVAERVPLAAVKHSGSDFEYHRSLAQLGRERGFVVFSGSDTRLPEAMALGAAGCISGLANAVPESIVDIFEAVRAGKPELVTAPVEFMRAMEALAGQIAFPLNIAAAMEARGQRVGAPKSIVSPATQTRYAALVTQFRKLYEAWKLDVSDRPSPGSGRRGG